jgi:hypothetical protein
LCLWSYVNDEVMAVIESWAEKTAAEAPPLSEEQLDIIGALL